MKKLNGIKMALSTAIFMAAISINAYAGTWVQNDTGWWYDWGNGSWPASSWQWIDGNSDGVAECYYFDRFGYCMINTTTPDNYQVNGSGAWVEGGSVQTRNVGTGNNSNSINTHNSAVKKSGETSKTEEQNKNDDTRKTEKSNQFGGKYLYDMERLLGYYFGKSDSEVTNKENKTLTRVLRFYDGGYAEYVAGGNYTKFKATVAPLKSDWSNDDRGVIQIMGDGDELYVTPDIYYDTNMFEIEVDISGYDVIRINSLRVDGDTFIGLTNARFE